MQLIERPLNPLTRAWHAQLALHYERRADLQGRTVLAARRHDGPLVVQKALYPEGGAVCHNIIVHPPAGIASGDHLEIDVRASRHSQALLTTPGAAKWYRSTGAWARQRNTLVVDAHASLEWLPQETIVFDGALARLETDVQLQRGARYIGWEVLCLGRAGSGERFTRGACHSAMRLSCAGKPLWIERAAIPADGLLTRSCAGLAGKTVCGTLVAAAENIEAVDIAACRALKARVGDTAVTRLPGVLVARYLGDASEAAKHYFAALWQVLRPMIVGREAVIPRIWNT
ncbi:MAG: urease accessory protein [Betaproteobacteria bacterium]|nr:urease accessory protein [Betaproteobacteria bacterium]